MPSDSSPFFRLAEEKVGRDRARPSLSRIKSVQRKSETEVNYICLYCPASAAKTLAESAVKKLEGVLGITNKIELKPNVFPTEVKSKIEEALRRSAELDARRDLGDKLSASQKQTLEDAIEKVREKLNGDDVEAIK